MRPGLQPWDSPHGIKRLYWASWNWQNCTSAQAVQRLAEAMTLRHQIAHGVNPRPIVSTFYANQLADLARKLARCTDRAVRDHFVNVLGIAYPWPP